MAARRSTLCSLLAALSITLVSSSGVAYDKNDNKIENQTYSRLTLPVVEISGEAAIPCTKIPIYNLEEGVCEKASDYSRFGFGGTGIVLKNKIGTTYIITNDHVLPPPGINSYHLKANGKPVVDIKRDGRLDLALLLLVDPAEEISFTAYEGCFGKDVSLGDHTIGVGYDNDLALIKGSVRSIQKGQSFEISTEPILGGNSGSPVYAFQNGSPVIVGMIRATLSDGSRGQVISVEMIEQFLADTPVKQYICDSKEKPKDETPPISPELPKNSGCGTRNGR